MKLFDYCYQYDYGHDFYLVLGKLKRFNVLDVQFHTGEWEFFLCEPRISMGLSFLHGGLFSANFGAFGITLSVCVLPYRFRLDLDAVRGWQQ